MCCAGRRRISRRRICREDDVPARNGARSGRHPRRGVVPVLKLTRQPYYRWLRNPITGAEWAEAHRANALFDAHRDDPEFGHRLLADEAGAAVEPMADRTAWRIASRNGWWSVFGKKRGRNGKKPGPAVHDDRCVVIGEDGRNRHVFAADGPNRIVGYAIDSRMKSRLAARALRNAVATRGDVTSCVVHSDRASQFRSRKFLRELNPATGCSDRWGESRPAVTTRPWSPSSRCYRECPEPPVRWHT